MDIEDMDEGGGLSTLEEFLEGSASEGPSVQDLEKLWPGIEVENDIRVVQVPPNADILDFIHEQKEDITLAE